MTWTLDTDTGDVYDHTGSIVTTLSAPYRSPDDVLAVIGDELDARGWDVTDKYVREAMKTALIEDIETNTV